MLRESGFDDTHVRMRILAVLATYIHIIFSRLNAMLHMYVYVTEYTLCRSDSSIRSL